MYCCTAMFLQRPRPPPRRSHGGASDLAPRSAASTRVRATGFGSRRSNPRRPPQDAGPPPAVPVPIDGGCMPSICCACVNPTDASRARHVLNNMADFPARRSHGSLLGPAAGQAAGRHTAAPADGIGEAGAVARGGGGGVPRHDTPWPAAPPPPPPPPRAPRRGAPPPPPPRHDTPWPAASPQRAALPMPTSACPAPTGRRLVAGSAAAPRGSQGQSGIAGGPAVRGAHWDGGGAGRPVSPRAPARPAAEGPAWAGAARQVRAARQPAWMPCCRRWRVWGGAAHGVCCHPSPPCRQRRLTPLVAARAAL